MILGILEEKEDRLRQQPVISGHNADEEERETERRRRQKQSLLDRRQRRQDKLRQEIEQDRERDTDAA
jgi:hypothetical protein